MRIPRKIIFLPEWYPSENDPQNGIFIRKHARAAALENQVVVLHAQQFFKKDQRLTKNGNLIEIIMYYEHSNLPYVGKFINFFNYMMAMHYGWQAVKRSGFLPEIIHLHVLGKNIFPAILLKSQLRVPHIISEHWSGYATGFFAQKNFLQKWLSKIFIKKAAAATVVSEFLKNSMMSCGLIGNFEIIPNVVEVPEENFKILPSKRPFTFLTVADLNDDIKNISGIIKAFSEINKENPETKLIIGGEGRDRAKLEQLTRTLFLKNSCTFTGILKNEEVLRLIPKAHVITINSNIETFSVLTLESIISGRPVIATKCGGPEAFINNSNGILIKKNNETELADAMRKIISEYKNYPPEKVKNSIQNIYDLKSVGKKFNELYDRVG